MKENLSGFNFNPSVKYPMNQYLKNNLKGKKVFKGKFHDMFELKIKNHFKHGYLN